MKFFRVIGRSFRDALKSVGRNFSLSLASITCVMITLIIVGVALIITYNVEDATAKLKKDLSIVVFVSNDADEFDIKSIETQIKGIDNVDPDSVVYKDKAEIKKQMMDSNETFQNIMENWDDKENPLQNPPPYEKLIGDLKQYYSRRINIQHRLVYKIDEKNKTVKILSMWTHYENI